MEMIPIAGGALAVIGLVMMAVSGVMLARGNKRQVKVVIPTSTAGRMPAPPKSDAAPAPRPEPKKAETPPPPAPPEPAPPKPPAPKPEPPPAPEPEPPKAAEPEKPAPPVPSPDPRISEEGTRIAMIPGPTPSAPPPPPPPEEATIAQPLPTAPTPSAAPPTPAPPPDEGESEEPQSTIAITPDDMKDFRTIVEQEAPKSYGILAGISGGMEGRQIRIDEEGFVIGRDQRTAQLVISDPRVSKRHVWVGVKNGEVWAVDVGSTNGTYLNVPKSERITEVKLKFGDILILSEDAARFEYREK